MQPMEQRQRRKNGLMPRSPATQTEPSAVVASGSPFDRNSGRLRPLLKQIQRFTSSSVSGENIGSSATTNTLDLGGGQHGTIKFKMIRQADAWLINDAVDENGKSLVGD